MASARRERRAQDVQPAYPEIGELGYFVEHDEIELFADDSRNVLPSVEEDGRVFRVISSLLINLEIQLEVRFIRVFVPDRLGTELRPIPCDALGFLSRL